MMNLRAVVEKTPMPIGFAAQCLEVEVGSLTGAAYGERTPEPLGGVARLHDAGNYRAQLHYAAGLSRAD
jgi:hypothetical protein